MSISSISSYTSSVDYTEVRQNMSDTMAKNMLKDLDTDGDGSISKSELKKASQAASGSASSSSGTSSSGRAGVMRWFMSGLTNGLLEGLNSLIQAAKVRALGFRSARKMKTVIYLLLSKLDFRLPCAFPNSIHSK